MGERRKSGCERHGLPLPQAFRMQHGWQLHLGRPCARARCDRICRRPPLKCAFHPHVRRRRHREPHLHLHRCRRGLCGVLLGRVVLRLYQGRARERSGIGARPAASERSWPRRRSWFPPRHVCVRGRSRLPWVIFSSTARRSLSPWVPRCQLGPENCVRTATRRVDLTVLFKNPQVERVSPCGLLGKRQTMHSFPGRVDTGGVIPRQTA